MTIDKPQSEATTNSNGVTEAEKERPAPLEVSTSLVSEIVKKLTHEPFLFVLGVVALLIALVLQGTAITSSTLQLVVITIAVLAFIAIVAYYIVAALQITRAAATTGKEASSPPATSGAPRRDTPTPESIKPVAQAPQGPTPAPATPNKEAVDKGFIDASHATIGQIGDGSVQMTVTPPGREAPSAADSSKRSS
jgi:hypothetical protein